MYIDSEDEIRLYHLACDISRTLRDYFYFRKNLPNDGWSLEGIVNEIYSDAKLMHKEFKEYKKSSKED